MGLIGVVVVDGFGSVMCLISAVVVNVLVGLGSLMVVRGGGGSRW